MDIRKFFRTPATLTAGVRTQTSSNPPPKKSGYYSLLFNGRNHDWAFRASSFFTYIHSTKIKEGNQLEKDILHDAIHYPNNLHLNPSMVHTYNKLHHKGITNLHHLAPCLISGFRIQKHLYTQCGEVCKNKTETELDFISIDKDFNVSIFEVKNGCDFDTKKSNGEKASLSSTMNVLNHSRLFNTVNAYIVCYDAIDIDSMNLKTDLGPVTLLTYEDMAEIVGILPHSRQRIDQLKQDRATHLSDTVQMEMRKLDGSNLIIDDLQAKLDDLQAKLATVTAERDRLLATTF